MPTNLLTFDVLNVNDPGRKFRLNVLRTLFATVPSMKELRLAFRNVHKNEDFLDLVQDLSEI